MGDSKKCTAECQTEGALFGEKPQVAFMSCYNLCRKKEGYSTENSDPNTSPSHTLPKLPDDGSSPSNPDAPDTSKDKTTEPPIKDLDEKTSCVENFDDEVSACAQATLKASNACDENNSALSNAANLASQITLFAGQKGSMGIQESCSKMAKVAKAASIALIAYRQKCSGAVAACTSACSVSIFSKCSSEASSARLTGEARSAMSGNLSSCQIFSAKMAEAAAAAQNFSLMQMNSQSCSLLANGTMASELCKSDPDYPGCAPQEKMDCTNPKMAENKVCVCSKTPNDPLCTSQSQNSVEKIFSGSTNRHNKSGNDLASFGDRNQNELPMAAGDGSNPNGSPPIDGKQGENANLGSSTLESGLEKRLKEKKGFGVQPVIEGVYGESGGADKGLSKKYEKLQIEDENKKNASSFAKQNNSPPNLKDFLPGGIYNRNRHRGIAGETYDVGIDGITGPHSNIWMKIKNRYQAITPTLFP